MKKLLLLTLTVVIVAIVRAESITPEQALLQAQNFIQQREATGNRVRKTPAASQFTQPRQVSGLYVFNIANDGGFVIVSNDDRTIPILGYSDCGSIDFDHMPDNMRAWLQGYADEIAWLQKHDDTMTATVRANAPQRIGSHSTNPITPLLSTTWNQGTPYNNLCPEYSTGHKAVTGCVATAMAQAMYYTEIKAGNTTTTTTAMIPAYETGSYGISMPAIEAGTPINWNNMKHSYDNSATAAQKQAVAELMLYCGCSVRMNYGPSSGSNTNLAAEALKKYFGYSASSVLFVSRSYYSYANWTDMMYNELQQGRPVLYGGQSSGGGHEFVCDGYKYQNNTDYFHINWGWGGTSDNYFVLSVLNPSDQGIGGSSSTDGFHYGQDAVIGIQKTGGTGTVLNVPNNVNLTINSITLSQTGIAHGETVTVNVNVTNNSNDAYDGELCLMVNNSLGDGKMFVIAAHATQNCTFEYTPAASGTYIFKCAKPTPTGGYSWDTNLSATLRVDDRTPSDLTASDVTSASATVSWTSDASEWNLKYRPLTITETDFSDGLPAGWSNYVPSDAYWIITPSITLGGYISFWAGGEGTSGSFAVYLNNGSKSYSQISQQFTVTSTRKEYTVNLSNYSGTSNLAFIIHEANTNSADIDNITFVEPGDWLTVNNITTNPYTLTGLSTETHYEVQVQAIIDGAATEWSDPLFFSTPNLTPTDMVVYPTSQTALIKWTNGSDETKWNVRYLQRNATTTTYDFDAVWKGWAIGDGDGDGKTWGWSGTSGRENSDCFISASVDGTTVLSPQNNLFSPVFNLGGSITFWARGLDANAAAEQFRVKLLNSENQIIGQLTDDIVTTAEWTQYTINLRKYTGTGRVMFVHNTVGGQSALCIDDVTISEPADDWVTIHNVMENPYLLTGLSASSTYDVEVQAVISETITSNWSKTVTFTTASNNSFELADATSDNTYVINAWNNAVANVTLAGRTLYKDGDWNTICLPFNVTLADSPLAGAIAKTLSNATMTGNHVNLSFGNAVDELQAGTPYIIKWEDGDNQNIVNPVFNNVTINASAEHSVEKANGHVKFIGYYDAFSIDTPANDDIYYMTAGNTLKHTGTERMLHACRAYFQFSEEAKTRLFILDFGDETTGIDAQSSLKPQHSTLNTPWYTIDGKKLDKQPTRKGMYIKDGRLVVI